tara:strand:+ start:1410 stop:2861 length:1452 start_codon:yes stop_codon:yes gene_type:complete
MTNNVPHFDVIAFLNGYGSITNNSLKKIMDNAKPSGFGSITCGINSGNRFYIEAASTSFGLATTGTNPEASREMFGFDGTESVSGSGPYTLTASKRWARGVFQTDYDTVGGLKIATSSSATMTMTYASQDPGPASGQVTITFTGFTDGNINNLEVGGTVEAVSAGTSYTIAGFTVDGSGNRVAVIVTSGSTVNPGPSYQASYTSESVTDIVPSNHRVQNLVAWIRQRTGVSDADDIYADHCLERFEFAAGNTSMTVVLEEDGRISLNYPSSVDYSGLASVSAAGEALFRRLGFDGTETVTTTTTNHRQIKGSNRAPCVLATGRGYVSMRREVSGRDELTVMADGSVISSGLAPTKGWSLTIRVDGPAHGYASDMEKHLRNWWTHARRGLTIYPSFGDPNNGGKGGNDTRRHADLESVYGLTSRHNETQTVEADESETHYGKRVGGRILARRHPSDQQSRRESYSGQIDIHQDIILRLIDDPSR